MARRQHSEKRMGMALCGVVTVALLFSTTTVTAETTETGALAKLRNVQVSSLALAPLDLAIPENGPLLAQVDFGLDQPVDILGIEKKSPTRAFFQSFLIPGWGQYYTRSAWWKPVAFLGIEAASWFSVSKYNSTGNDIEDEYEAFADEHWDGEDYLQGLWQVYYENNQDASPTDLWLDTLQYTFIDVIGGRDTLRTLTWSHHAFYKSGGPDIEVEKSEFYENIGKYNQFTFGWDDFPSPGDIDFPESPRDPVIDSVSPNRQEYLVLREDSNKEFKKASTFIVVAFANHLVSGLEAALGAKRFNRSRDQFGTIEPKLRWVRSPSTGKPMPQLTLGYKF